MGDQATNLHSQPITGLRKEGYPPYLQNRELSWLTFNERVLDQGSDETVPMLERWNFVSIFWSNLQEFFMVRVGSLTDLSLAKKEIIDSKSGMTPAEQINAIHERCHELYPIQERVFEKIRTDLMKEGVHHLRPADLDDEQRGYLSDYFHVNVMPFLSPQIINSRHPFPHLENGALYVVVLVQQAIGLVGETAILLGLPGGHEVLAASILRFIAFDAAGLVLMAAAFAWLRK